MKFPFYRQLDSMDCGPSCLRMICKYYGKSINLSSMRSRSSMDKTGVTMLGLSKAAESFGFNAVGVKLSWSQLRSETPLPCIVHWGQNHFVVLYKVEKSNRMFSNSKQAVKSVYIADPGQGLISYSENEFLTGWSSKDINKEGPLGVAMLLHPTPEFYKQDNEETSRIDLSYLLKYFIPYKSYLVQLILATLVGTLISLSFPFLTQTLVDEGIGSSDLAFVIVILLAQLFLTIGQSANELIRSWILLHITSRVSISMVSGFLAKLLKLPILYFNTKGVGDIMQRIGDHNRIQSFITGSLVDIIFSLIIIILYTVIMASYDYVILFTFYIGSTIYILWVIFFLKQRRKLDHMRFKELAANQGTLVELIESVQEIKLNNIEVKKRWEWEKIQARLFHVKVKELVVNQYQNVGSKFINQSKNIFISFLAAKAVIDGTMTLGMMMAIQYILGQLNAPLQQFISFSTSAQDAKLSLERINEIHKEKDEERFDDGKEITIPRDEDIVFKDVTFKYNKDNPLGVINGANFIIAKSKVTAIVGASGSGKSTLLKLILGIVKRDSGEIYLGERSLEHYSPSSWRKSCGVVMQDGYIFSDTILNNICMIEDDPDPESINESLNIANLKKFTEMLPYGVNTLVGKNGQGLSSGQKQRLLIARSVYKNPAYIMFDEATNSLDTKNESEIMSHLANYFEGRTVVVIAHRLSTIKKAHNILVMDSGIIVEQGNHNELMDVKGFYYDLIQDQLNLES